MQKKSKVSSGVIVEGLDSCLVKFAQCCNPLPGDEIIGFITRGSGVSIHKLDCPNVINSMKDPEQQSRWVAAEWADTTQREVFKSSIELLAPGSRPAAGGGEHHPQQYACAAARAAGPGAQGRHG